jgi:hypothetical protein
MNHNLRNHGIIHLHLTKICKWCIWLKFQVTILAVITLKTFIKFPLNRSYAATDINPFPWWIWRLEMHTGNINIRTIIIILLDFYASDRQINCLHLKFVQQQQYAKYVSWNKRLVCCLWMKNHLIFSFNISKLQTFNFVSSNQIQPNLGDYIYFIKTRLTLGQVQKYWRCSAIKEMC